MAAGDFVVVSGGECRFHGRHAFCALCGRGDLREIADRLQARLDLAKSDDAGARERARRWRRMVRRLGLRICTTFYDKHGYLRRLYDIDHVLPRCEGGPNHPTNLRVLCLWCHKRETARLAARRADQRRTERGAQ